MLISTKIGTRVAGVGIVGEMCKDRPTAQDGHFYCIIHKWPMRHPFEQIRHTRNRKALHKIIWICREHGPEAFGMERIARTETGVLENYPLVLREQK